MNDSVGKRTTQSIQHLSVSLFTSVMGISELSIAWTDIAPRIGEVIGIIAIINFIIMSIFYIAKIILYFKKIFFEFKHPIMGNFFGTIPVSLLLISSILVGYHTKLGQMIWICGTIMALSIGYIAFYKLKAGNIELSNIVPVMLVPGVASLDIAATGGRKCHFRGLTRLTFLA